MDQETAERIAQALEGIERALHAQLMIDVTEVAPKPDDAERLTEHAVTVAQRIQNGRR